MAASSPKPTSLPLFSSSSLDFPEHSPQFSLSSDQFQNCSRALRSLKQKLENTHLILSEFDSLEVINCSFSLVGTDFYALILFYLLI